MVQATGCVLQQLVGFGAQQALDLGPGGLIGTRASAGTMRDLLCRRLLCPFSGLLAHLRTGVLAFGGQASQRVRLETKTPATVCHLQDACVGSQAPRFAQHTLDGVAAQGGPHETLGNAQLQWGYRVGGNARPGGIGCIFPRAESRRRLRTPCGPDPHQRACQLQKAARDPDGRTGTLTTPGGCA